MIPGRFTSALMNTAFVHRRQGKYQQAAAEIRQALRIDPHSADYLMNLGWTLFFLREYPDAWKAFDDALAWAPESTPNRVGLAQVALAWKGDTAPAKLLIARYPTGSDPGGRLTEDSGLLTLFKLFPVEAAAVVAPLQSDLIVSRFEFYPKTLILGAAAEARGDPASARRYYEAAATVLEQGVREHPTDHRWHTVLGRAYALLGRKEEADREGRKAVELLPISKDAFDGPTMLWNLALIHATIGDSDAAIEELQVLLSAPGGISPALLRVDYRWGPLRNDPRFRTLAGL